MIRINQLKLAPDHTEKQLKEAICKMLKINEKDIIEYHIAKRSIDSRHKPKIEYIYCINANVTNENDVLKKITNNNIMSIKETKYRFS